MESAGVGDTAAETQDSDEGSETGRPSDATCLQTGQRENNRAASPTRPGARHINNGEPSEMYC